MSGVTKQMSLTRILLTENSSDDEGENLENLACSAVSPSISAAKKKPTPILMKRSG